MNWSSKIVRLLLGVSLLGLGWPAPVGAQAAGPQYQVQAGDTFYGIAAQFGITQADLQAANPGINPAVLRIDQVLNIPGYPGVSGMLGVHRLEPGETLASLALRLGLRIATLVSLNRIVNPDLLYINEPVVMVAPADALAVPTGYTLATGVGRGLYALAAAGNLNPWALAAANRYAHPGRLPPRAVVIVPGGELPTRSLPYPFREVGIHPLPAEQGRTIALKVVTARPVQLSAALGDWPVYFSAAPSQPETQYALLGIDRLTEANLYRLQITVTEGAAAAVEFVQAMPVRSGNYGSETLIVDPATLDPAVVEPELALIKSIVAPVSAVRYWDGLFALPSVGGLTSRFGTLRSYNNGPFEAFHTGVDFSGSTDRPITAPAPGMVVYTGTLTVRGQATLIDHGWGVYTGYWHQSVIAVNVGDRVETGQIIGYQGGTGRVTGPHLHWELWVGGHQVDPLQWTQAAFP